MENIRDLIYDFFKAVERDGIEIYNEFSLQHEMGIFLRESIPNMKVQFERNVSFFRIMNETVKKEIDIVIFDESLSEKYAIELKAPRNGQYPEQMYSFIKDIKFMEQIKKSGFNNTYAVTYVEDKNFYSGSKIDGIYSYFRNNKPVEGKIVKPTGNNRKNSSIDIEGEHEIVWVGGGNTKYYILEI